MLELFHFISELLVRSVYFLEHYIWETKKPAYPRRGARVAGHWRKLGSGSSIVGFLWRGWCEKRWNFREEMIAMLYMSHTPMTDRKGLHMLLFVQLVIFYGFYYGKSPFFNIIWIFSNHRFQADLSMWVLPPLAAFVQAFSLLNSAIFFEIHWLMCLEVRKDDGNLLHLLFVMLMQGIFMANPVIVYYLCKIHYPIYYSFLRVDHSAQLATIDHGSDHFLVRTSQHENTMNQIKMSRKI